MMSNINRRNKQKAKLTTHTAYNEMLSLFKNVRTTPSPNLHHTRQNTLDP